MEYKSDTADKVYGYFFRLGVDRRDVGGLHLIYKS